MFSGFVPKRFHSIMGDYKKIRTFTRVQTPLKSYDKASYFDFIGSAPNLLELNENEELKTWFETQFGLKLEPVPKGVNIYKFFAPGDYHKAMQTNENGQSKTLTIEIMLENCNVENECVLEYMSSEAKSLVPMKDKESMISWNPIPYEFIAFDRSLVKHRVSPYRPNHMSSASPNPRIVLQLTYKYTEPVVEDEKKGFLWAIWSSIPEFRFY